MLHTLYGDGIHDDFPAIQEMLDSGLSEVNLPAPAKYYCIGDTLRIHSYQTLVLPHFARIRLLPDSNCYMATNADQINGDICVGIHGGIWDYANTDQLPNPIQVPCDYTRYKKGRPKPGDETKSLIGILDESVYHGYIMNFYKVKNLELSDITFKDPVDFCATLDTVSYFTVKNIIFDFNLGNPSPKNMDGIHLNGNCHHGVIKNLKGACYDDLVALNSDEGSNGDITDILIDGIFAENCHSAVRLLSVANRVANIHITNIFGTFYQYCIGVTRYYDNASGGYYDALTFDKIYASKAFRDKIFCDPDYYEFPIIFIDTKTKVKRLTVSDLSRCEKIRAVPTFGLWEGAEVDQMILDNIVTENLVGGEMKLIDNQGVIRRLEMRNVEER